MCIGCTAGNVMELLNFKVLYWKSVIQFQYSVLSSYFFFLDQPFFMY